MPELPEVENLRLSLLPALVGARLNRLVVYHPDVLINPGELDPVGHICLDIQRRGKYLRLCFDNDLVMEVHLRMTGHLLLRLDESILPPSYPHSEHIHVGYEWEKDGRAFLLLYQDTRRFGRIELISHTDLDARSTGSGNLGPEPFADECNADYLCRRAVRHSRMPLKSFLLDQNVIAGLGNIYVDEILFAARLNPLRPAAELTVDEAERIVSHMRRILKLAIAAKGTTFRDYVDGHNLKGSFQEQLFVYGRGGEPCRICGTTLANARIGGRNTVYCPTCQPGTGAVQESP
ncbi:MAG: bifunctional DNA-formamidopyrimidine glycosylase/DNA-(apurinic or apyrimidinic site) lyase [Clostridiaceae bacterium]|nr:bifunctional DNA-formamidopyrimidine glycosylase/DNA-(apurinic or apyrimidinic site) lyase [Clostridiaceae bacterium]